MVAALKHVAAECRWNLDHVKVWVDYCSIPQACSASQTLAIRSLTVYASSASAFVVVAPDVQHDNTDKLCNLGSYRTRMWCRAEQLCYTLSNGEEQLWIATGSRAEDSSSSASGDGGGRERSYTACVDRVSTDPDWLKDNLRVFQVRDPAS